MTDPLFRIGTPLALATAALAAVPKWDAATGTNRRSAAARRAFRELQPCPATGQASGVLPGYVVDHIVSLTRGGAGEGSRGVAAAA